MKNKLELRPYQKEDVIFLSKLKAGACFNEQRTGKTPVALNVIKEKNCNKVLILCPASAVYSWVYEYERWLEQPCNPVAGNSSKKKQQAVLNWEHGLVASYDSVKETKSNAGLVNLILKQKPDMIILDEAHRIRNRTTATATAAFKLGLHIPNRLVLTGTPAPSHCDDIWSILHFLYPKHYTSYWNWVEQNCYTQRKNNPNTGRPYVDIIGLSVYGKHRLTKELNSISTMRKRKEVMPWLPDKTYREILLPLTKEQKNYIAQLEEFFEIKGTDIVTKTILDNLIRVRQICNAPALVNLKGNSPKLDWLVQYTKDYPDTPTIVFSNFTSFLKLIKNKIPQAELIVGDTPIKERARLCKLFQQGKIPMLLINIVAGKEALTLDNAEVTIFTDKYPPVGNIDQAEDRFVATTREKKDKQHLIIELIMDKSYDKQLYTLLRSRYNEVDIINNYTKYLEQSKC